MPVQKGWLGRVEIGSPTVSGGFLRPARKTRSQRVLHSRRRELFAARRSIAQLVAEWRLDDWFRLVTELAASLAGWRRRPLHRLSRKELA
jgi:hypothetical protein